jgi:hypothetical protein
MSGTAIMCVDSVVPRQEMAQYIFLNPALTVLDFRMGLYSGQFYLVHKDNMQYYKDTLNFTDEEADAQTPKSACQYELSVAFSIWSLVGYGIYQLVRYWNGNYKLNMTTLVDMQAGVIRI